MSGADLTGQMFECLGLAPTARGSGAIGDLELDNPVQRAHEERQLGVRIEIPRCFASAIAPSESACASSKYSLKLFAGLSRCSQNMFLRCGLCRPITHPPPAAMRCRR
jgi:hypothetical protein